MGTQEHRELLSQPQEEVQDVEQRCTHLLRLIPLEINAVPQGTLEWVCMPLAGISKASYCCVDKMHIITINIDAD